MLFELYTLVEVKKSKVVEILLAFPAKIPQKETMLTEASKLTDMVQLYNLQS